MSLFDEDLEKIKKGNFCGTFDLLEKFTRMSNRLKELERKMEEKKKAAKEEPPSNPL